MNRVFLSCLLLLSSLAIVGRAETCPVISDGSGALATVDAGERLEFIRRALREDQRYARNWRTGWLVILSVVDAAELSLAIAGTEAPTPPEGASKFKTFLVGLLQQGRYGLYAGSITAAGGVGSVLLRSARTAFDADTLDRLVRTAKPGELCTLLASAEGLLQRDAHDELLAHGAIPHIVTGVVSVTTFLIIGLVFHRWPSAAINAGLGLAGGELLIATEPRTAELALTKYRLGDLVPLKPPPVTLELSPTSVALRF